MGAQQKEKKPDEIVNPMFYVGLVSTNAENSLSKIGVSILS